MKNNKLLKTNLLISIILIAGFVTMAIFSYRANYQISINNIEQGYDEAYVDITKEYLNAYQEKYGFNSVFPVSAFSDRYYSFNGLDRGLRESGYHQGL